VYFQFDADDVVGSFRQDQWLHATAPQQAPKGGGVERVSVPAWSPNLNAFAERFVESAKSECLDRIVPLVKGCGPQKF
jgi:hypothetical protein